MIATPTLRRTLFARTFQRPRRTGPSPRLCTANLRSEIGGDPRLSADADPQTQNMNHKRVFRQGGGMSIAYLEHSGARVNCEIQTIVPQGSRNQGNISAQP